MPPENRKKPKEKWKKPDLMSREEVARIADLAKISLTQQEQEKYSTELSTILEYFNVMDSVPPAPSAYGAASLTNAFRDEQVVVTDPEPILAGVPERSGRFVKAPRVS